MRIRESVRVMELAVIGLVVTACGSGSAVATVDAGLGGGFGSPGMGGSGATGAGGVSGMSGLAGSGGSGTGGSIAVTCSAACAADEDCMGGSCVPSGGYGMTCTTTQDCPANSTCCDGSNESCDGTSLPTGDGTNIGEFVVSTDGLTVTDTITGLVWQRDGSWADAQAYCASLTLGSLSGWRLPARNELMTILDLAMGSSGLDPTAFTYTYDLFWTSSPDAGSSGYAWFVDFLDGSSGGNPVGQLFRMRCVR